MVFLQDVSGLLPSIEKPLLKPRSLPAPQKTANKPDVSGSGGYDRKKPVRDIYTLR